MMVVMVVMGLLVLPEEEVVVVVGEEVGVEPISRNGWRRDTTRDIPAREISIDRSIEMEIVIVMDWSYNDDSSITTVK
mgnify:CR=1 FL=1